MQTTIRRVLLVAAVLAAGCSRQPPLFNDTNARAHISMLAGSIGSRPVGTAQNARAREYIVAQLKQSGFDVRIQETDARRHELGRTARVSNVIGVLPGERSEAIALVSHYDSSPDAPGATDAALGVAVALEAARIAAASGRPRWSMFVLITDGEESGLMGAAGLVTDREVMERLRAYLNLESIGSSGTSVLFQTGPGNGWLVRPWARRAPHPRGGSYAGEVYRRLPNDTDFTIFETRDIPGLNFAATGDSYAYHTARDTPERLSRRTVQTTGENVVAIVHAMQALDITTRNGAAPTFFDVGGRFGVSYGPLLHWLLSAVALAAGVIGWMRVSSASIRLNGVPRWLAALAWAWLGAAVAAGAMVAATFLLRSAREVYHPWYARPGRLLVLLVVAGAVSAWAVSRAGRWLPARVHPVRHPALTWSAALPAWIGLTAAALWVAPSAAYLWVLPLSFAGLLLALVPPDNGVLLRLASLAIAAVSGTLWLRETHDLSRFVVAVMGRLPLVTPSYVYAALLAVAGVMVAPPLVALLAPARPLRRPWGLTAILLLVLAGTFAAAYAAPAYTPEQPLRRFVRALQDGTGPATWEVASVEPGLDLGPGAPGNWVPAGGTAVDASVPWGRFSFPFVFRTAGPALGPAPVSVGTAVLKPLPAGTHLSLSVIPRASGLTASFVLPPGVIPARSSLPGIVRQGRWTATFVGVPEEGLAWEASLPAAAAALEGVHVVIVSPRLPGGEGWQSLPAWLPQGTAVWSATATWVLPARPATDVAPAGPLR